MNESNAFTIHFRQLINLRPGEARLVGWSFFYFFSLLCSYYIIRPVRDEMGITGGVDQLQWLFTGTFIVMLCAVPLFGALSARLPRRKLLPVVYLFFICNLLIFYVLFHTGQAPVWSARFFFIWVSVFNLFIVSVFWSFMADIFSSAQGKRLFAVIASGGTAGAIAGPMITTLLVQQLHTDKLLLISIFFLACALLAILTLGNHCHSESGSEESGLGGHVFDGLLETLGSGYLLGIALFIWCFSTLATFLYFEQAHIVSAAFSDAASRTRTFAAIDLAVNSLTIFLQLFVTGRIMQHFGLTTALAAVPALLALGFMLIALTPVLPILIMTQVIRRAGNYAVTKPAREVLFTTVSRNQKYKAKNFIDTVVYRGSDALAGWMFAALKAAGLGLAAIAWIAVPLALFWMFLGIHLGRWHSRLTPTSQQEETP